MKNVNELPLLVLLAHVFDADAMANTGAPAYLARAPYAVIIAEIASDYNLI